MFSKNGDNGWSWLPKNE